MTGFEHTPPQQQQALQQAQQQQQQLKQSPSLSAADARLQFLHEEISRLLTENGFVVHPYGGPPQEVVPRGVTVRIDRGVIFVESDGRSGPYRMRESFQFVPKSVEGTPQYILGRYQFEGLSGMEVEPGYYGTRNKPISITEGLPAELKSALEQASKGNN